MQDAKISYSEINNQTIAAYKWYAKFYAPIALAAYWLVWRGNLSRHIKFFRHILDYGDEVVDIATGDGTLTKAALFSRFGKQVKSLTVLDISLAMLDKAQKKLPAKKTVFMQGNVLQLPFSDNSLPIMTCFGGLNSFPSAKVALMELARVLSKDSGVLRGSLLLMPSSPWRQKLVRKWIQEGYQTEEVTKEMFFYWIKNSSLRLTQLEQYGDVLLFELRKV